MGLPQWLSRYRICLPMQETQMSWVQFVSQEDPQEKEMTTHTSIFAWKIPWTEELGRLQSMGSQSRAWLSNFSFTSWKERYDKPREHIKKQRITWLTKVHLVKAMVFPVVIYGCESWTIKKVEHQRVDAFELWCWRRLLRVPWTVRRSNQSILKELSPEYSLEGLMLKLKL